MKKPLGIWLLLLLGVQTWAADPRLLQGPLTPGEPAELEKQARTAILQEQLDRAQLLLERLVARYPTAPETFRARRLLALLLFTDKKFEASIPHFEWMKNSSPKPEDRLLATESLLDARLALGQFEKVSLLCKELRSLPSVQGSPELKAFVRLAEARALLGLGQTERAQSLADSGLQSATKDFGERPTGASKWPNALLDQADCTTYQLAVKPLDSRLNVPSAGFSDEIKALDWLERTTETLRGAAIPYAAVRRRPEASPITFECVQSQFDLLLKKWENLCEHIPVSASRNAEFRDDLQVLIRRRCQAEHQRIREGISHDDSKKFEPSPPLPSDRPSPGASLRALETCVTGLETIG